MTQDPHAFEEDLVGDTKCRALTKDMGLCQNRGQLQRCGQYACYRHDLDHQENCSECTRATR